MAYIYNKTPPPSSVIVLPEAKENPLLAIHAATLATSSGLPHLFIGDSWAAIFCSSLFMELYVAVVAILPNAKLYALMLFLAYSLAIHLVSDIIAALVILYKDPPVYPVIAGVDEILMIIPPLPFSSFFFASFTFPSIKGMTAFDNLMDPFKSTSIILSKSSNVLHEIFCSRCFYLKDTVRYLLKYQFYHR